MDNKIVAGLVVALIVAGGVYFAVQNRSGNNVASDRDSASFEQSEASTMKALLGLGRSQECTFSSSEEGYDSNGTVWVTSGKMRGDFTTTSAEETYTGHIIVKDNASYIWTDGEAQGMKMAFDPNDFDTESSEEPSSSGGIDTDANYEFSCKSWRTDNSKFDLPSGVEFIEWQIPAMPTDGAAGTMPGVEMCNQLPEPGKTECINALQGSGLEAR